MNHQCNQCGVALVPVRETSPWSIGGLIATAGVMFGLLMLLLAPLLGLAVIVAALLLGMALKAERTVMRCPGCGARGRVL